MSLAPVARGYFVGDYVGLGGESGDFIAYFSMTQGSDPANIFARRFGP